MKVSDIRDILTTAVEGGSNYWAGIQVVDRDYADRVDSAVFTADDTKTAYSINANILAQQVFAIAQTAFGTHKAEDWEDFPKDRLDDLAIRLAVEVEDVDHDAEDADNLVQIALFGEVVYG